MSSTLISKIRSFKKAEGLFSALYIGFILIIIAAIYLSYLPTNLWLDFIDFINHLTLAELPGTGIYLPAPLNPATYSDLYSAAFLFCVALGILEVVILGLRFFFYSPTKRKAETIENIVFWLGAGYLLITYLNSAATINTWFVFWTGIIIIFGLSLIARAFVLLVKRQTAPAQTTTAPPATTTTTTT